jgi:hypothetical protein
MGGFHMTAQLMTAVNNRDGDAMARMATGGKDPQKLINIEAERLVDALFRQLKQIFRPQLRPICAPTPKKKQRSANGLPPFLKTGFVPVSSFLQVCVTRDPVSHHSGHRRVSSSSGAKTAAQSWGYPCGCDE